MENKKGRIDAGGIAVLLLCLGLVVIMVWQFFLTAIKEKTALCKCKTSQEIILLHEKRSRFIDALEYPNHQLTKKEKDSIIDSVTHYTNLLR
jgi:hypothetical protein